jgi:co-chaperonin GroES (HSP10)
MTKNESGVTPVEYRCVVKLDAVERKSAGGIIYSDDKVDRNQMASVNGMLIAVGGNAFADWGDPIPRVGDRVTIMKYAGQFRTADPNDPFRIVNDKDILAIVT